MGENPLNILTLTLQAYACLLSSQSSIGLIPRKVCIRLQLYFTVNMYKTAFSNQKAIAGQLKLQFTLQKNKHPSKICYQLFPLTLHIEFSHWQHGSNMIHVNCFSAVAQIHIYFIKKKQTMFCTDITIINHNIQNWSLTSLVFSSCIPR